MMGVECRRLLPTEHFVALALLLRWNSALLVAAQHHGQQLTAAGQQQHHHHHHTAAAATTTTTSHVKLFTIYDQQEELWDNASTHHAANLIDRVVHIYALDFFFDFWSTTAAEQS